MLIKPKRVEKEWGYELWFHNSEKYCGKKLYIKENWFMSFHYHNIKEETFVLDYGNVLVRYGESDVIKDANIVRLQRGDAFHVKPGLRHQIIALHKSCVTEFSTQHFDEDSIRIISSGMVGPLPITGLSKNELPF